MGGRGRHVKGATAIYGPAPAALTGHIYFFVVAADPCAHDWPVWHALRGRPVLLHHGVPRRLPVRACLQVLLHSCVSDAAVDRTVPPKVRLMTTSGGRVRFGPNLYRNGARLAGSALMRTHLCMHCQPFSPGKVCLSILGCERARPHARRARRGSHTLTATSAARGAGLHGVPRRRFRPCFCPSSHSWMQSRSIWSQARLAAWACPARAPLTHCLRLRRLPSRRIRKSAACDAQAVPHALTVRPARASAGTRSTGR